jgi:hypothetical protein
VVEIRGEMVDGKKGGFLGVFTVSGADFTLSPQVVTKIVENSRAILICESDVLF